MQIINGSVVLLTDAETFALDEAINIIEARSESENQPFDKSATEWWLIGLLSRGAGTEDLIKVARDTPFRRIAGKHRAYA